MSQNDAILDALLRGERITPLDALRKYGCFRLGARIYDIRKSGYMVDRKLIDVGNGKHVAEYSMPPMHRITTTPISRLQKPSLNGLRG